MKRILSVLFLLMFSALPALGQDDNKLPPPHVTYIRALDFSQYGAETGWCLDIRWQAVDGAEGYAIRVAGNKGLAPRNADDSARDKARWKITTQYSSNPEHPDKVMVCGLAHKQKVKFRLRSVDVDTPLDAYGTPSTPYAVKLPKYGKADVLAYTGVPTIEVFG